MKKAYSMAIVAAIGAALTGLPAMAAITVTYEEAPAPTYAVTLNFDEPGGPTGEVAPTAFQATHGLSLYSGSGTQIVDDWATQLTLPWLGDGLSIYTPWGAFMEFDTPLTEFSCQYWDTSGPGGPFGGGAAVVALSDGEEVANFYVANPTFSETGPTWVNITTDGGSTFDEVRLVGFGFFPEAYMDNASWNLVPEPAGLVLLSVASVFALRRR